MVRECVECQHKQIGYSSCDGDPCEKCGGYTDPKGWAGSLLVDELHEYSTPEQAREALIYMDRKVVHDALIGRKDTCQSSQRDHVSTQDAES